MRTIEITIEYDGGCFLGFQRQPGKHTLQADIECALSEIYKTPCPIKYAGRTDRGVHAKAQVVVFQDDGKISLPTIKKMLCKRLDYMGILSINEVCSSFDPRRYATSRRYEYWCYSGEKHVFMDRFMWYRYELPVESINYYLNGFQGKHDFSYLSKHNEQVKSTVREVYLAKAETSHYKYLGYCGEAFVFTFEANGFLHHMIRKMVGLVWSLVENRLSENDFQDIISLRNRHRFEMAPPQGLYLSKIMYDESLRELHNEK